MEIVNSQTYGDQYAGTVTALEGGGYVVAWRGPSYSGEAIWFQRFDAEGNKVGPETWAKDVDPAGKEVPRLVGLDGGRFLVNDQLFDAAGIPTGGANNTTLAWRYANTPEGQFLSENDPRIAGLPGGGYVTVEPKLVYVPESPSPIQTFVVRWFDESGRQVREHERPLEPGAEFAPYQSGFNHAVVALPDGKVVVTWEEDNRRSGSGEFDLFSPDGQLLKHEVVASRGDVNQLDVTPLPDGGFIVMWAGANYMGPSNGFYQRYDAAGARVGEPVDLGPVSYSFDPAFVSSATATSDGDVALVFEVRRPDGSLDIAVHELESPGGGGEEPPPGGDDGEVITSPGPNSQLTGTDGDDTLVASRGSDTLTGGAGDDTFAWVAEPWSPATVTDFTVGQDRLDLSAVFQNAGYAGSDPIADGRIVLMGQDGDTLVLFDDDGQGGDWPNYIIRLEGVDGAGLTWAQLSGGGGGEEPPPPGEDGEVINSDGPGDSLTGGAGADTLNASRGSDTLTGAGGADRFVFADENWSPATITDFTPGQDRIDVSGVFDDWGYAGTDPIADGRMVLLGDGAGNTKVLLDDDGQGGDWPNYVLFVQGVTPDQLAGSGNWIFQ